MKMKTILFGAAVVFIGTLSSCSGGYTCPTYMQDNSQEKTEVMVKVETVEVSENI